MSSNTGVEPVVEFDGCRITREPAEDAAPIYRFEDPIEQLEQFRSARKVERYAAVYDVIGGFREEKTGERGLPPAVARGGEAIRITYLSAQPTMGVTWVARAWGIEEAEVHATIDAVFDRSQIDEGCATDG